MMRSFAVLLNTQPGFSTPEHLQTMRVAILQSIASDPVAVTRTQNEIGDKLAQLPGVSSVGYAADVPMDDLEPNWNSIFVQGRDSWGAKSTTFRTIGLCLRVHHKCGCSPLSKQVLGY
jgi:hypothetical protein